MYLSTLKYPRYVASYYQHFTLLLNKKSKEQCQQDDYTFTFRCTSEEQLHFNPIEKKCYNMELKIQGDSLGGKNCIAFMQIALWKFLVLLKNKLDVSYI